eukprot:882424-Pyramimonas_sp.AAC.1
MVRAPYRATKRASCAAVTSGGAPNGPQNQLVMGVPKWGGGAMWAAPLGPWAELHTGPRHACDG